MQISFTKLSDEEHSVHVQRQDGSEEQHVLNSRSFLRHDFAHLAIELEIPLPQGYWGAVAGGASLKGNDITGTEILIAESIAGPVQTLMRVEADADQYLLILERVLPNLASPELAGRIRKRGRELKGHWKATPYGESMLLKWGA